MTTRVWITRTQPAATRSADAWAEAGFAPVVAPLLTVASVPLETPIPDDAALIFTSANGVRFSGLEGDGRRVYAVGPATARAASDAGFVNVVSGSDDWKKMLEVIEISRRPIFHISGWHVRGRIVETLRERGAKAHRVVAYRSRPVDDWPVDLASVDCVALYSPLAAQTLMALPERDLSHMAALCLSRAVAEPLDLKPVHIADRPTEAALIACSRDAGL